MKRFLIAAAVAIAFASSNAWALVPTGVSITETAGSPNEYTVDNQSGSILMAFGVTNPTTTQVSISGFDPFAGGGFNGLTDLGQPIINGSQANVSQTWGAVVIDVNLWTTFNVLEGWIGPGTTLFDLFGAWTYGTDVVNWYEPVDASLMPDGDVYSGFFFDGTVASTGLVLLEDSLTGNPVPGGADVSVNNPNPVPVPAAGLMLAGGLLFLAGLSRRRK